MEVEPQVHARGFEEEEEMEVEEAAPLIRKHKSDGTLNGGRNEVVPVVQLEIEKDEGGGDVAKPMVYFDGEERRESSDRTIGAITPSNGHKTDTTAVEEIVESMPFKHLVKEDSERTEFNLEAVLRDQNTHDLYCPNCNSCITRRVILRKRKRTVPVHSGAAKREKVADPSDVNSLAEQNVDAQPEVFGCLQCLSLFVRTATGYELLSKMFRGRDGHTITSDDLQNDDTALTPKEDTVPAEDSKNTNCLAFLLEWGKRETEVKDPEEKVASIDSQVPPDHTKQNKQKEIIALDESGMLPSQQSQQIVVAEGKVEAVSDSHVPEDGTGHENQQEISVLVKSELVYLEHHQQMGEASDKNVGPANSGSILENYVEGLSKHSANNPSGAHEKIVASKYVQFPPDQIKRKNQDIIVFDESDMLSVQQSEQILVAAEKVETASDSHGPEGGIRCENQKEVITLEKSELVYLQQPHHTGAASDKSVGPADSDRILENDGTDLTKYSANNPFGEHGVAVSKTSEIYRFEEVGDSGEVMQGKSVATSSKTYILALKHNDGLLISSETKALPEMPDERVSAMPTISHETRVEITSQVGDVAENNVISERTFTEGWDILKAIVYGGLTESITSLGVTSSAAGGDASTLAIVALGLANLVGGLFVIAHNVLELKHDVVRYTEAIGQPQNFWRNTIVVIVSYICFGLVSPITYGLSFRKSDNKDYKLIAVAIASLLCILILALGKARVTDKSYIRRIISYAALGVAVSGVSYVVGVYVKKLLDQLGWISGSQNMLYPPSLIIEATGRASQNWVS